MTDKDSDAALWSRVYEQAFKLLVGEQWLEGMDSDKVQDAVAEACKAADEAVSRRQRVCVGSQG